MMTVGLLPMMTAEAPAQRLTTTEITGGACMVVCDDVSFCRAMDYDRRTGTCTIFMNPAEREFRRLRRACPHVPPAKWVVSFAGGRWKITCPPRRSDGDLSQEPPTASDPTDEVEDLPPELFEGLEDPQ
ncbi:MAG TPA: hypothetical protein ENK13_05635 [Thermopetrobacter sp.]|nr:hypothetical protein [Thermopetrobacter sp.]